MNIPASETFIPIMLERIVARFAPYRVILFGSHARETNRKCSDVDLLVVLPDSTNQRQAAVEIHRTLGDLPVAKDIVVTTPEEIDRRGHVVGSVVDSALREGKTVYERR